ncbi:MAG: hypothetical protein QMO91_04115 [Candidatus Tisiphia sp.]|nr:hypothetical protein [Candidatus Tisiphia sp.]
MLKVLLPKDIDWSKVDICSQDETRIGQQGSLSRIWAKRGSRPRGSVASIIEDLLEATKLRFWTLCNH